MISSVFLQDNAFPFEFGVFEIEDEADLEAGDAEVIEHLTEFVVGDAVDDLGVHHHLAIGDEVGNVLGDLDGFVEDREALQLLKRDVAQAELHHQSVFVWFFVQSITNPIQDLQGAVDDVVHLLFT